MRREKQRYEKPAIKFVEIDLNSCIAVNGSTYTGTNNNMLWGGNSSYHDKDVTVNENVDLSHTWDNDSWNNR